MILIMRVCEGGCRRWGPAEPYQDERSKGGTRFRIEAWAASAGESLGCVIPRDWQSMLE